MCATKTQQLDIFAWATKDKKWIPGHATPISDSEANWISYKFMETLAGEVPSPSFRTVNNVRKRVAAIGQITWYNKDSSTENRDTDFEIRPAKNDYPLCDLGIRRSVLWPNGFMEVEKSEKAGVLLDENHEIDIENDSEDFRKTEEERPTAIKGRDSAKEWFEKLHKGRKLKQVNIFDDGEEEVQNSKATSADTWFKDFGKYVSHWIATEHGPKDLRRPRIAILDTGLDEEHTGIRACAEGNFKGIESFTDSDTRDFHGHGTFIASLILKIAPQSHLYVAKVAERQLLPLKHNVPEAIRWAIEQDVDIITMSFGMETDDREMEQAIREAYNKGIIIFAAASNGGGNKKPAYPARNAEVIAIYATDGAGNKASFNPTPSKGYHFALPGEAIESFWTTFHNSNTENQKKRKSGTSYATPIAAGIAAVILYFAKLHRVPWYEKLRSRQGMCKVFEFMAGTTCRDGYDYICPWSTLFTSSSTTNPETVLERIRTAIFE